MKLDDLIKNTDCTVITGNKDIDITDITLDSREVEAGNLFICIKGAVSDGHQYIKSASEKGASAVLVEDIPEKEVLEELDDNLTIVKSDNTERVLGTIAANFCDHPADKLTTIGVTGTKGKTTVANLLRHILENEGLKTGIIGTLGIHYDNVHFKPHNTTPDSITLQKAMRGMVDTGCQYAVMEASSQGFKRNRLGGFDLDIGIFLNIDRDHIGKGEHANFKEYLDYKRQILSKSKTTLINKNPKLWTLLKESDKDGVLTFSLVEDADYRAINIVPARQDFHLGISYDVRGKIDDHVDLKIPGEFNVENTLAALAAADQLGLNTDSVITSIESFIPDGRAEILESAAKLGRTVLVDFAHNKLSIESVLKAMRAYNPKHLISMFGLHWNETEMRRYDQGYAAGKYSDYTILTRDHVGPISFEEINKDTIRALKESGGKFDVIEDRKEAIEHAIEVSEPEDIVVLFGMGNERSQRILDEEVYFSEEEIVEDYLKKQKS